MKKTIYTIAFVALFAAAGSAQNKPAKAQNETQQSAPSDDHISVNPDGTLKDVKEKNDKGPGNEEQPKTRMAITQKGLPAPKAKENNAKPAEAKTAPPAEKK